MNRLEKKETKSKSAGARARSSGAKRGGRRSEDGAGAVSGGAALVERLAGQYHLEALLC